MTASIVSPFRSEKRRKESSRTYFVNFDRWDEHTLNLAHHFDADYVLLAASEIKSAYVTEAKGLVPLWTGGLDVVFGKLAEATTTSTPSKYNAISEQVAYQVVELFAQVEEVSMIYQDVTEGEIVFYVFTDNEEYSDPLLDTLIGLEQNVLRLFPKAALFFRYVALVLCDDPREVTGLTATLIFQR